MRLTTDGVNLKLEYSYAGKDGREVIAAVRFFAVLAYRFEQYSYVTSYQDEPWTAEIMYALAEVADSPWVEEIETVERGPWPFAKRHFLTFLGDVGLFAVIADHFEVMPPRDGRVLALDEEERDWFPGERPDLS